MADITLSYKGSTIATMSASGSKTIQTKEKYCEDDIRLVYEKPGNAFKGDSVPSSDLGYDGDIYFLMSDYAGGTWAPGYISSSTKSGGWAFRISRAVTIKGIRVFPTGNTCSVYLNDNTNTQIKSVIDQAVTANAWNDIIFDSPVTLTNTSIYYRVWFSQPSGYCSYSDQPLSCGVSPISFSNGLYSTSVNQAPSGNADGSPYGVDIILDQSMAHDQYVKISGVWTRS